MGHGLRLQGGVVVGCAAKGRAGGLVRVRRPAIHEFGGHRLVVHDVPLPQESDTVQGGTEGGIVRIPALVAEEEVLAGPGGAVVVLDAERIRVVRATSFHRELSFPLLWRGTAHFDANEIDVAVYIIRTVAGILPGRVSQDANGPDAEIVGHGIGGGLNGNSGRSPHPTNRATSNRMAPQRHPPETMRPP